MSELKFIRKNNGKYNTTSINIVNAFIEIAKDDYKISSMRKTKFGYTKANIQIFNDELKNKLKSWETEINEYLKNKVRTRPVTILYGNMIYPKVSGLMWQNLRYINIKSVWINEKNIPFVQLWYEL